MKKIFLLASIALFFSCAQQNSDKSAESKNQNQPFVWEGANVYFLMTDRFNNGDTTNDISYDRTKKTGTLRGFEGGDIKGITKKIKEGYFTDLGINAVWMTLGTLDWF